MKLISLVVIFLCTMEAVHADEREQALALGATSATGILRSGVYLKNLEKEGYGEKFRVWEEKDLKLWNAVKRKQSVEIRFNQIRPYIESGEYDRRTFRLYSEIEKEYHEALEDLKRLQNETSRSHAIDFNLGVFVGERRKLMNRWLIGQAGRLVSLGGGLTALYKGAEILSHDFSLKQGAFSESEIQRPNLAAPR
jgi:hypothetical protein